MAQQQATHWRKVHKRKNDHVLFAEDLGPVGTKVDVEVVESGVFSLSGADNKSKAMPWLAFRGKTKKLGLNVTNSKAMQSICGTPMVEQWRGWITLVVVRTTYTDAQTKERVTTDAIRIAAERPKSRGESSPRGPDRGAQYAKDLTDEQRREIARRDQEIDREVDTIAGAPADELSDEDRRAIEMAEREESNRG